MGVLNNNALILIAIGLGIFTLLAVVRWWFQYNFRDKTVLLTGGSRGLGLIMARELVRQGARLAICGRNENSLERAHKELVERGGDVLAVRCDVTDKGQVDEMVTKVRSHFGQIDVLINNAGIITVGPMEVMTLEDYETAMKMHFWAPLYTTLAVLPEMRSRQEGRIVNISSIGGKVSAPHLLPYSASKFALTGFSEGLRAEVAKDKIVVTTVCPGLMRTGSPYNANFKGQHRAEFTWFILSDSLPIISMSAERAARQILAACKRGDSEIVLSLTAQLAIKFHDLFPGITASLLGFVNKFLPEPGGIGTNQAKGKDSTSDLLPSVLTALSDKAAQRNNQF
ncbi:MAG: SDR family NAD(P)-dependent oxidoreductase [Aphanothece sp. CMT-3BRIN-NPC111]|jgi:short-subunit dehydrogenase|nr:SDR family NAD(P)-dependent oxidoreductase [Aphanothece sp. CMT-3BRIN-NPC111]